MGNFAPLFEILKPLLNDAMTFLQAIAILGAAVFAIYNKLREILGNAQEDQMYAQKTTKIFQGLVFIFLIPTIIKIIQAYFMK